VVARHAILRTGFVWENGTAPRQVVHPAPRVRLNFHHAEFGSESEARHGLEAYLAEDRREGFKSLDAPLLRIALLCAGPRHYWWVATFHHLLLDGRALVLMFKEVHEIHDALVQGQPLDLPTPWPYRNYIQWLQTLSAAQAEKFWRERLKGLSAPTVLPIARPAAGPAVNGDFPGELAVRLTEVKTSQLRAVAAKHKVTMNTMMQAAWAVVLSRSTGDEDVVFGAVRACRHIPVEGAGSIIGLFINTVPVRVRVPAGEQLGAWLQELREQWVALRDYEHTPLMKAQQWSEVPPGRPLFETLLNYQDPSWDMALRQLGGAWERREFDIRSQPNYPLAVDAYGGPAIIVKVLFDRSRFADDAIVRLIGHIRVVLESLASDVEKVGDLALLTPQERHQLLGTWNRTTLDYPREACVHTFVEAHAEKTPAAVAVVDGATTLAYGELNARANQLAHCLKRNGVGPDSLVAVCMERSAEMLVAWLGVLKAGGAFVPLDPNYPAERLAFQLEDCAASLVLTQPKLRSVVAAASRDVSIIEVTADGRAFGTEPTVNLAPTSTAGNLAYVIYTSGSTGQPKGVQIEHRALMNLVTWHQHAFAVTAADRATQLASPAFDASVWETWPYLATGASVHIPNEETRIAPAQLWQWLAANWITIAFLPTPLAEAAMNEAWPGGMALRLLLTGGDKLKRGVPENFPCELINNYGPTENTVVSTSGRVARRVDDAFAPTIGRPVANTQCYVLDRRRQAVPVGVPGELYVGGESLARGYLNRRELTAEKFVACPLDDADLNLPARLYRTGDLVRWTAAGEIEFLGRLDGQVKIRGCRIELGEIESTLQAHPCVRESLVLARADERGTPQLVAYFVAQPDAAAPAEQEMIEFLRAKLPAYMIPSEFVLLEALPLSPNGKLDRRQLPAPESRRAQ
ncbi:MAG TPA: amino acid adenylation domain-containing protein, partial [Opitutaceae bacterium]|nr:amino acid adenylation domain-containing protein [Opitutaceae bacterium]